MTMLRSLSLTQLSPSTSPGIMLISCPENIFSHLRIRCALSYDTEFPEVFREDGDLLLILAKKGGAVNGHQHEWAK
ncbi:MAG: hypothetical protein ABIB93_06815, partial [Chloroflexota bacterium]